MAAQPLVDAGASFMLRGRNTDPIFFQRGGVGTLLLLTTLSDRVAFGAARRKSICAVVPRIALARSYLYEMRVLSLHRNDSKRDRAGRRGALSLPTGRPVTLAGLDLGVSPSSQIGVIIAISSKRSLRLSRR